jgi:hypothetical protein
MRSDPPPAYKRVFLVTNRHADTHGQIGMLVNVLDMSDDPDFRERRFVLRFAGTPDCAMHSDEVEQVYV